MVSLHTGWNSLPWRWRRPSPHSLTLAPLKPDSLIPACVLSGPPAWSQARDRPPRLRQSRCDAARARQSGPGPAPRWRTGRRAQAWSSFVRRRRSLHSLLCGLERCAMDWRKSLRVRRHRDRACPADQRVAGDEWPSFVTVQDAAEVTHRKPAVLTGQRFGSRSVPLFDGVHDAAVLVLSDNQDGWQVDEL